MIVDMKPGAELANHLAATLDDLTFELLVRARINREYEKAHIRIPDLSESYNNAHFEYSHSDKSKWRFGIGHNYNDSVSLTGEVLAITAQNAMRQYELQHGNKLSLLLPAPDPVDEGDTALPGPDDNMKW